MSGYSPFQDYAGEVIRSSLILSNSYVAGTVIGLESLFSQNEARNQLVLLVSFTKGSLTSGEIKVEFSHDGSTYYQETFASILAGVETDSLGEHTFLASGNYRIPVQMKDHYVKVSAKGTGTFTDSLMSITAIVGVA